jgi:hypothetical protein
MARTNSNRRVVEWSLLVVVVLGVVGFLGREFRVVQGMGELAAIKTTLGALRTALVIDHLKTHAIDGKPAEKTQGNPFLLLDHVPANYAGLLGDLKGQPLPQGGWVFDAYCRCIGYEPLYPQSLENGSESSTVWFRISPPPGPLKISPVQDYIWLGELVK